MKQLLTIALLTLVMAFMPVFNLHSQESNKVLLIIRDGSGDLEFMLKKEVKIMQETIENAGFKVEIATLSGEPISAGSVRINPDLKISDVSVQDYEGFILPCLAVDDRVVPPQKDIVKLMKEVEDKPVAAQLGSIKILAKAGLLKDKKYASAIEFSDSYFEGSILSGSGVVKDGNIMTSGICPFMARRDEIQDGTEELAITLVKALKARID